MNHPGHRNYSRPIQYSIYSISSRNNDSTLPTMHAHQHPQEGSYQPFSDTNARSSRHHPRPVRTILPILSPHRNPVAQPSKRSKSVPRARPLEPDQRPPSPASSSTHVQRPARDSFLSQDSTATSAYPPSTITSAFSGPDTPPSPLSPSSQAPVVAEHTLYTPSIRPDDISSRLRLLAVNSYFLVCIAPHGSSPDASVLTWSSSH